MRTFKNKNVSIPYRCVITYIEETMDKKGLILNATPQNDAIKIGTWRFAKKGLWALETYLQKGESFAFATLLHCSSFIALVTIAIRLI